MATIVNNTVSHIWKFLRKWIFLFYLCFNWRIIALQNCVGFCQTSTWISHRCTYVLSLKEGNIFLRKSQSWLSWVSSSYGGNNTAVDRAWELWVGTQTKPKGRVIGLGGTQESEFLISFSLLTWETHFLWIMRATAQVSKSGKPGSESTNCHSLTVWCCLTALSIVS